MYLFYQSVSIWMGTIRAVRRGCILEIIHQIIIESGRYPSFIQEHRRGHGATNRGHKCDESEQEHIEHNALRSKLGLPLKKYSRCFYGPWVHKDRYYEHRHEVRCTSGYLREGAGI